MHSGDYSWRTYTDGPALYLGSTMIAMVSPIPSGVRVAVNVGTNRLRFVFLTSESQGIGYLEAWARKWNREIRAERAGLPGVPHTRIG